MDITDKAKEALEKGKDVAEHAADKAKELGGEALDKAKEIGGKVADKTKEVASEATKEGSFLDKLKDKAEELTGIDINRDGKIGDTPIEKKD
ncbi:MAG: hypothetical protein JST51_15930 [Armatimonadetes bacterium]|nr:hypothetical protein [Armatimonadota bacterium]